jgi:hypothetical protein
MLVLVPGNEVGTVHVSPVDTGWNVSIGFPSIRGGLERFLELSLGNSAATVGGLVIDPALLGIIHGGGSILGLRESVDCGIVERIILLLISGIMPDRSSPGIDGSSP